MNIETLHDLFETELRRTYAVETKLADALTTLADDADVDTLDDIQENEVRDSLGELLSEHAAETADHVARLEEAFEALDRQPETRSTPALDGLIEEKERFNNVVLNDEMRPLYYLGTGEQIERLEIGLYKRLLRLADHLDVSEQVSEPFERNLEEERSALESIQSLAESDDAASLADAIANVAEH